jgi:hypothetical protein
MLSELLFVWLVLLSGKETFGRLNQFIDGRRKVAS